MANKLGQWAKKNSKLGSKLYSKPTCKLAVNFCKPTMDNLPITLRNNDKEKVNFKKL